MHEAQHFRGLVRAAVEAKAHLLAASSAARPTLLPHTISAEFGYVCLVPAKLYTGRHIIQHTVLRGCLRHVNHAIVQDSL